MSIINDADNFVGNLVRGVGVFTLYAGLVSGIYITLNAIRARDYKNITIYALMTGGLFYGLTKLNKDRPWQPVGPLTEMEIISSTMLDTGDWDEEEAEWV